MICRTARNLKERMLFCIFVIFVFSLSTHCKTLASDAGEVTPKLLIISIDSLDPACLSLNSNGEKGGKEGDWLLPNIHAFLENAVWFEHIRDFLPAATDMNHLNAVAGTSSAQTGILGISLQFYDWNPDGRANFKNTSMDFARDDLGRPVDTLFKAWKRRYPASKIFFASGKEWVANMFHTDDSGIDIFMTGTHYPDYISSPWEWNFFDPPNDANPHAWSDRTSLYQYGFCKRVYEDNPSHFPCDNWMVISSLKILEREKPDLAMIILAECDDLQHGLGSPLNPDEFDHAYGIDIHRRNEDVHREPILDGLRDVDEQFGTFITCIRQVPEYKDAVIVLYSDHGHITYNSTVASNFKCSMNTNIPSILYEAGTITKAERDGIGFALSPNVSIGEIYFQGSTYEERLAKADNAKAVLEEYSVYNPQLRQRECPWYVLGKDEMINGVPGLCEPGELFHAYYAYQNESGTLHWPDLIVFLKNGWQLPITSAVVNNLGTKLPSWLPPMNFFLGGHGSNDTAAIVLAIQGPGYPTGKILSDPEYAKNYRISDIAVTLAKLYGLELLSTTIGQDRSQDLK